MDVIDNKAQNLEIYIIAFILSIVGNFQIITRQKEKSNDIFSVRIWVNNTGQRLYRSFSSIRKRAESQLVKIMQKPCRRHIDISTL